MPFLVLLPQAQPLVRVLRWPHQPQRSVDPIQIGDQLPRGLTRENNDASGAGTPVARKMAAVARRPASEVWYAW